MFVVAGKSHIRRPFDMAGKKFYALLILFFLLCAGGCGGGGSSSSPNQPGQNNTPTPIASNDPTPIISNDPTPIISNDPTPIISIDPTPTTYTVIFDAMDGSGIVSQSVSPGQTVSVPDEPERENSSFMGWYPSEGFAFRFDFNTPISRDITLYAKWWDNNDTTDSDNDGMPDELEMTYGTDPFDPDTDNDGLTDWDEINWLGYNPLAKDTNGNGVNDGDEDADNDGLTNILEGNYGTNMIVSDTDHDGLTDSEEVMTYNTDPLNPDTDGDGVNDGVEVAIGSDPLTAETSFETAISSDYTSSHPEAADISVKMTSSADAAGSLTIAPADFTDSPHVSRFLPGYIAAYTLNSEASFDRAEIEFTLGSEAGEISGDFQPAIYYLDEAAGIFCKVEGQRIEGRKIIAEVSHFSIYVLLNSIEFDIVWSNDIRPPSTVNTTAGNMSLDIVFVIDYSYSMVTSDPQRLALELSKNFIDKLRDSGDKAAVVKFSDNATIVHELSDDKESLQSAIDTINYRDGGSTDGTTGVKSALDILDNSSAGYKYIIFLTDGEDNYYVQYSYDDLIQRAKDSGVIIYTIGLGSYVVEDTLKTIASGTGGAYYKATTGTSTDDVLNLEDVYKQISDEAIDMTTDSNHDGITDYYTNKLFTGELTINGLDWCVGVVNNVSDDWDGDGIKNGDEITISVDQYGSPYVIMKSIPVLWDSDFDGYSDSKEINEMGTSPLKFTMLPSDFDYLRQDSRYPAHYVNFSIPGSNNTVVNILEGVVKFFAGDKDKQAKELFIDYFYKYSTSEEVLSRDASIADWRTRNQNIIDGLHVASKFINMCNSIMNFFDTVESGKYTATEQAKKLAKDAKGEADKFMAIVLNAKKVDINNLNGISRAIAKSVEQDMLIYVTDKNKVSTVMNQYSNIVNSANSLSLLIDDFKKTENGAQFWSKAFQHTTGVLNFSNTLAKTLATFTKVELPCRWEWAKKFSDWKGGKGGKALGVSITVAVNVLDTTAEVLSIANTYGKIEANYAEYYKFHDLLKSIENDPTFPDYVRNGAGEVALSFDQNGEPDWNEFDKRVRAAQGKEIALGTLKTAVSVAATFFPVVAQVKFVYDGIKAAWSLTGAADMGKTMVAAEVYYSIASWSRAFFLDGTTIKAGYYESVKDSYETDEAGKYAVQLAQARIVGLEAVKGLVTHGKISGAIYRIIEQLLNGKSKKDFEREYNNAIDSVYTIAKKCGMRLSENLPRYEENNP